MPHISLENKEIVFKLVYYGPGLSGKTTNLLFIHRTIAENRKGEMISLDTADDRTLFFDFFPVELGEIDGFSVRFHMYTVPGQVFYEASRRLILEGADGVVFVADSQPERMDENVESFRQMEANLRSYNIDPREFPLVLQYNKRDCEHPMGLGTLQADLSLPEIPVFEAVAVQGRGVMPTVREVSRRVIQRFQM